MHSDFSIMLQYYRAVVLIFYFFARLLLKSNIKNNLYIIKISELLLYKQVTQQSIFG